MPIEDTFVVWDEEASTFAPVATIKIGNQNFDNPETLTNGERFSFNP